MIYHTYKTPSVNEEEPIKLEEEDEDLSLRPLKDGILSINTGFPIIIGLNKSDILLSGEA